MLSGTPNLSPRPYEGTNNDIEILMIELETHTLALERFMNSLPPFPLARIETKMDEIVHDAKTGKRKNMNLRPDTQLFNDVKVELQEEGITKFEIEAYSDVLREYLNGLIGDNEDEKDHIVETQERQSIAEQQTLDKGKSPEQPRSLPVDKQFSDLEVVAAKPRPQDIPTFRNQSPTPERHIDFVPQSQPVSRPGSSQIKRKPLSIRSFESGKTSALDVPTSSASSDRSRYVTPFEAPREERSSNGALTPANKELSPLDTATPRPQAQPYSNIVNTPRSPPLHPAPNFSLPNPSFVNGERPVNGAGIRNVLSGDMSRLPPAQRQSQESNGIPESLRPRSTSNQGKKAFVLDLGFPEFYEKATSPTTSPPPERVQQQSRTQPLTSKMHDTSVSRGAVVPASAVPVTRDFALRNGTSQGPPPQHPQPVPPIAAQAGRPPSPYMAQQAMNGGGPSRLEGMHTPETAAARATSAQQQSNTVENTIPNGHRATSAPLGVIANDEQMRHSIATSQPQNMQSAVGPKQRFLSPHLNDDEERRRSAPPRDQQIPSGVHTAPPAGQLVGSRPGSSSGQQRPGSSHHHHSPLANGQSPPMPQRKWKRLCVVEEDKCVIASIGRLAVTYLRHLSRGHNIHIDFIHSSNHKCGIDLPNKDISEEALVFRKLSPELQHIWKDALYTSDDLLSAPQFFAYDHMLFTGSPSDPNIHTAKMTEITDWYTKPDDPDKDKPEITSRPVFLSTLADTRQAAGVIMLRPTPHKWKKVGWKKFEAMPDADFEKEIIQWMASIEVTCLRYFKKNLIVEDDKGKHSTSTNGTTLTTEGASPISPVNGQSANGPAAAQDDGKRKKIVLDPPKESDDKKASKRRTLFGGTKKSKEDMTPIESKAPELPKMLPLNTSNMSAQHDQINAQNTHINGNPHRQQMMPAYR